MTPTGTRLYTEGNFTSMMQTLLGWATIMDLHSGTWLVLCQVLNAVWVWQPPQNSTECGMCAYFTLVHAVLHAVCDVSAADDIN